MLTLTDNARAAVKGLADQADLPETGGLRIAESAAQQGNFELSLVPEPHADDHVIDAGEANVFVEATTAEVLQNQSLDAQVSEEGTGFSLAPRVTE